ncbi:peptidylprolyl isomerase [Methylocaldum gracile]|jgi:peptidyl-prolyl cis-trans isomerase SurA|uniref:peptidylprolyl isomerase n=1 Tax=unclassified Methylocaldum TaxID=2622260 RepID=UPI00105DB167
MFKISFFLSRSTRFGRVFFLSLFLLPSAVLADGPIDRIVAVVEDGVILESELRQKVESIKASLLQNNTQLPPDEILTRQVLERLIVDKIQVHLAEKAGIRVDDETLRQAVQQIAQRNNMSLEEFRRSLRQEGIDYAAFIEQIRNEITVGRLRSSQVNSQIKVSDHEVQHYLETHGKSDVNRDSEYLLGHILIATPQAASPSEVQKAKEKAERLVDELRQGLDFKQAALSSSDSPQALSGGDLGWRKLSQVPSLFADLVPAMKEGGIEGPIRSPSGFHIIKLLGVKGGEDERMTKTHVRHILIKPNEVLSDEEAKQKLLNLKTRIEGGEDFATLARGHSDDKGSAIKGGDLGFVQPGALVPPFEEAMNRLAVNQLSDPVQTQFGWHLLQVLERQESSDTDELLKNKAREEIFKRKAEEETELWLRRIRDEAYVEIRLNEPETTSFMPSFQ